MGEPVILDFFKIFGRTSDNTLAKAKPSFVLAETFRNHGTSLVEAVKSSPFIVFLCGPTIKDTRKSSAILRKKIKEALEKESFEVVLGEDDGLEEGRLKIGVNAQDSELEYISKNCNAVIIIADSVGAFCELGLFSWHFVHEDGHIKTNDKRTDCVLLIDEKYQNETSYLNQGPATAIYGFGMVQFIDFAKFDFSQIIRRLKERRSVVTLDNRRGRPREKKA